MSIGNGFSGCVITRCAGVIGSKLLSSGDSDVALSGRILLEASQSVKNVLNSVSVSIRPSNTLYNGFLITCTILSIKPL